MGYRHIVLAPVLVLCGCVGSYTAGPPGTDHPASAGARSATVRPGSGTLGLGTGEPPPPPAAAHAGHEMKGPAPADAPQPSSPASAAGIFTCPMHSEVSSDQPGRCPKCGMRLVKQEGER